MSSDAWAQLLRAGASGFNAARTPGTVDLRGANLDGVALGHADLSGADLSGASLKRAVLTTCKLDGAKLSAAHAAGADFSGNTLREVDLTRAYLEDASFDHAKLDECKLDEASPVHARFAHAVLCSMTICRARFDRANFEGARFHGVTLTECSLVEARFIGAVPRLVDCRSRPLLAARSFADGYCDVGDDARECPVCWEHAVAAIDVDWPPSGAGVEPDVIFACAACRRRFSSVGGKSPLSRATGVREWVADIEPIIRLPECRACGSRWTKRIVFREYDFIDFGPGAPPDVIFRCQPCGEEFQISPGPDPVRPSPPIDLDESWTGIAGELGELRFVGLARSACALLGRGFERALSPTPVPARDAEETRTRYGSPAAGLLVEAWHTSLAIEAFGLTPGNAFKLTVSGPDRVVRLRVSGPGVYVQLVREQICRGIGETRQPA